MCVLGLYSTTYGLTSSILDVVIAMVLDTANVMTGDLTSAINVVVKECFRGIGDNG